MRLMFLPLFIGINICNATSTYSQSKMLSLNMQNRTIKEVFAEIEKNSEFIFFYYDDIFDVGRKVSVNVKNQSIDKVLDKLFEGTDNSYHIIDRQVFISKKPEEKAEEKQTGKKITGSVIDQNGEALIGVSVVVKGTTKGTVTDIDGKYILDGVPEDATVVFSYVGYAKQEIVVTGRMIIDVTLSEDQTQLDEVVVVGYGTQKKETMVGAVSQVGNKALVQSGTTGVTNAIAGKLSGVITMQQSGEPGNSASEIIIRGLSSWNSSNPLVLVDGVERDFKDLDPNEINTISVLKDASATAVFGARGANGVLIVTTKRGVEGKPKLDVSASFGFERATRIPDHIDSYTTMRLLNVARMNEGQFTSLTPESVLREYQNPSSRLNALRYPNVNWFDELTQPFAPSATANMNVTGGTKFVKYFASLGYTHEGSYFKARNEGYDDTRFWYNRFNYRTNLDFNLSKTTLLSFNVGGEVGIKNQPTIGNMWWAFYGTSPARFPTYFPSWVLEEVPDLNYPDASGSRLVQSVGEYMGNPYNYFNQGSFTRDIDSKLFTDLILKQDLDFLLKGLSFQGKVSLSTYYKNRSLSASYTFPQYLLNYDKIGTGDNPWSRTGEGNEVYTMPPFAITAGSGLGSDYYTDLYYEFALNYANSFGDHNVSALALMNRQQKNKETAFPYYNEGLVGRVTYDFQRKYLAEFNVGYTGSERFAPDNRFGFFPSGAVGWVISEERFFKDAMPWFSKLKVRYSDGLVGSDQADSRWLYISDYEKDNLGYIREGKAANSVAQWEEARKQDLGIEMSFFNNTFSFSIDLFKEDRTKMLLTPLSTPWLIGIEFKDLNKGELKKHGIEIETEYRNTIGEWHYFIKAMAGINENRIIYKDDPPYTPDYQKQAGKPLGAQTSGVQLVNSGYYTSVDDIHGSPSPIALTGLNVGDYAYLDYTADGAVSSLDAYPIKGSKYPHTVYSFSGGFSYKRFEFNFMFQGNLGKYVEYNQSFEAEFTKGNYRVNASQLDYWSPTNPGAGHSTLHYPGDGYIRNLAWLPATEAIGYTTYIEDRFWRKADYLKLKEVYVGYTFEPNWKKLSGISGINVYATGNNLLTFTNLLEGDPERKDFSKGFYPQLLSVRIGVKVTF